MRFIMRAITWWTDQTLGTQFFTWRKGKLVGSDAEGNKFYQNSDGSRRWVIYNGAVEASRVSPQWHGWLHHTFNKPPTLDPLPRKAWEAEHARNATGSPDAYSPPGSLKSGRLDDRQDYSAWGPE